MDETMPIPVTTTRLIKCSSSVFRRPLVDPGNRVLAE
jgi:hypothetical protein